MDEGATLIPPTELSTALSIEWGLMVLLGVLALSAPAGLSLVLFRVLVKDGCPLDRQQFLRRHRDLFLVLWPMACFFGLFGILAAWRVAPMPDRLRAGSIMCASILLVVLAWFFVMLALRRKLWAKRPDFTKAFPVHFFYLLALISPGWTMLLLYYINKYFGLVVFWSAVVVMVIFPIIVASTSKWLFPGNDSPGGIGSGPTDGAVHGCKR